MKHKIGIIYSSFNNYDILEGEVLKRVNFNTYPVINIDDHSDPVEQKKGKEICSKHNIEFQINKKKGVQFAVNQGIKFLTKKYNCEWVFCMQQDVFPVDENFFMSFEKYIENYDLKNVGAIGFNILDDDNSFTIDSYKNYLKDRHSKGSLGIFFLSDSKNDFKRMNLFMYFVVTFLKYSGIKKLKEKSKNYVLSKRWFSEKYFYNFKKFSNLYDGLFFCELPIWVSVAINTKNWESHIKPSEKFVFHLWFNDIAMQWLSSNINIAVTSELYLLNQQSIKEKYGFNRCSATAGKNGDDKHVEKYGDHLINFEERWGFKYENPRDTYKLNKERYKNTLVEKYFYHDCRLGPLGKFKKKH